MSKQLPKGVIELEGDYFCTAIIPLCLMEKLDLSGYLHDTVWLGTSCGELKEGTFDDGSSLVYYLVGSNQLVYYTFSSVDGTGKLTSYGRDAESGTLSFFLCLIPLDREFRMVDVQRENPDGIEVTGLALDVFPHAEHINIHMVDLDTKDTTWVWMNGILVNLLPYCNSNSCTLMDFVNCGLVNVTGAAALESYILNKGG